MTRRGPGRGSRRRRARPGRCDARAGRRRARRSRPATGGKVSRRRSRRAARPGAARNSGCSSRTSAKRSATCPAPTMRTLWPSAPVGPGAPDAGVGNCPAQEEQSQRGDCQPARRAGPAVEPVEGRDRHEGHGDRHGHVPRSLVMLSVIRERVLAPQCADPSTPRTKTATGHCSTLWCEGQAATARTRRSVPATTSPLVRAANRRRVPVAARDSASRVCPLPVLQVSADSDRRHPMLPRRALLEVQAVRRRLRTSTVPTPMATTPMTAISSMSAPVKASPLEAVVAPLLADGSCSPTTW